MEPALARHRHGCSAGHWQMHAVWHVFASMPELTMGSPVLDWETDSCEACGPRCGHAASSSVQVPGQVL